MKEEERGKVKGRRERRERKRKRKEMGEEEGKWGKGKITISYHDITQFILFPKGLRVLSSTNKGRKEAQKYFLKDGTCYITRHLGAQTLGSQEKLSLFSCCAGTKPRLWAHWTLPLS